MSKQPEKLVLRDSEGAVLQEVSLVDGVLEGETVLYSGGRISARLQFHLGKLHGEACYYDEVGREVAKTNYQDGKLHGEALFFDPAGRMVRKAAYRKDQLNGRTIDYYPSGKPREAVRYLDNLREGETVLLDEDGKVKERQYYHKGKQWRNPPRVAPAGLHRTPVARQS